MGFFEIARRGLLITAYERLKRDQTTVSRRLQRLENQLDVRLFGRSRWGHKPTQGQNYFLFKR